MDPQLTYWFVVQEQRRALADARLRDRRAQR